MVSHLEELTQDEQREQSGTSKKLIDGAAIDRYSQHPDDEGEGVLGEVVLEGHPMIGAVHSRGKIFGIMRCALNEREDVAQKDRVGVERGWGIPRRFLDRIAGVEIEEVCADPHSKQLR